MLQLFRKNNSGSGGPVAWIVAGLGNPGQKYEKTRHNVGFLALDLIAAEQNTGIQKLRFHALCGECNLAGQRVLLLKPQTFMNNSGASIKEAMDWYKLPLEQLIVLSDDIYLPPGKIRIRAKGSDGGHNGLKSIIYHQHADTFPRIKIGVGTPTHADYDRPDWVLGTFGAAEGKAVTDAIRRSAKAVEEIIRSGPAVAASLYNGSTYQPEGQ